MTNVSMHKNNSGEIILSYFKDNEFKVMSEQQCVDLLIFLDKQNFFVDNGDEYDALSYGEHND